MPQIEVTFDIDANGIVHVHAKDLGTGREQSIRITASSGLSQEEIQKMVRDAESHADEDKKRRETIEARNHLDSLLYQTEKSLGEHGTAVDAAEKARVESAIADAKKLLEKADASPQELRDATNQLSQASHKLAEAMYAKASASSSEGGGGDAAGSSGGENGSREGKDDVVDADFEEVKGS